MKFFKKTILTLVLSAMTMTAMADDLFSLVPAPGEVSQLTTIKIYPQGDWATGNRNRFTITGPDGYANMSLPNISMGTYWEVFIVDDDEDPLTVSGEYTFTIPEGRFIIDGVSNPEQQFVYTIVEGADPGTGEDPYNPQYPPGEMPEYEMTPAPGTYETIDDGFSLLFDAESASVVYANRIKLQGPNGPMPIYASAGLSLPQITIIPIDGLDNPMILDVAGEYKLTIGVGAIAVDGASNSEALTFEYVLNGSGADAWEGTWTAQPAAGSTVESLKEIAITFAGARNVHISDSARPSDFPKLYDADGQLVVGAMAMGSGNKLNLTLYALVESAGVYTLVVPKALCTIDGTQLAEDLNIEYTIEEITPTPPDSIEAVWADHNDTIDVYSVGGALVLRNATVTEAAKLPKGVYVANNRKFLIK